jgi:hypothetical protein
MAINFLYFNALCSNQPYFNAFIFQRFVYTVHGSGVQLSECECVRDKYNFLGYFMIYSSETIGKEGARRQSEASARPGTQTTQ